MSALPQHPSSFQCSHPNAFLQPHLYQGSCSGGGHLRLTCQGYCGACSTPFSRLLQPSVCSVDDLGSWRPVIDLSHLNRFVDVSPFQMVTIQFVLLSVRSEGSISSSAGSSSFSSLPSLRFQRHCLPIPSAVLWPLHGSAGLHQGHGSRFSYTPFYGDPYEMVPRRLASPVSLSGVPPPGSSDCPPTLPRVGDCSQPRKSNLVPSQVVQYLGVVIDSTSFRTSPSEECISRLQSTAAEFQSYASPPASLWLSLLGVLSSLAHLVPGGRLRMRSLQLCLHRSWDRQDLEAPVSASMECLHDLQWWLHLPCLSLGVSLCQVSPDLHFWSDASDVGWGAHLDVRSLQACGTPTRRRYP